MAINKAVKTVIKKISEKESTLETSRKRVNIKAIDPLKKFYHTIDYKIYNKEHEVPIRIYLPKKPIAEENVPVILFFHGGGWVTESVETYNKMCKNLADKTGFRVVSVDYRLAPEYKFPTGLEDCYAAAKALYCTKNVLKTTPENIVLMGDSAGANFAAAISLMAKERGDFTPKCQILIYPCVNNDFSEQTPYASVMENGEDYFLTRKNLEEYIALYKNTDEDLSNPYFSPILAKDLTDQPDTLIITGELDPLRDEGEAYGKRLLEAGNQVDMLRIKDAVHGYFSVVTKGPFMRQLINKVNEFLAQELPQYRIKRDDEQNEGKDKTELETS